MTLYLPSRWQRLLSFCALLHTSASASPSSRFASSRSVPTADRLPPRVQHVSECAPKRRRPPAPRKLRAVTVTVASDSVVGVLGAGTVTGVAAGADALEREPVAAEPLSRGEIECDGHDVLRVALGFVRLRGRASRARCAVMGHRWRGRPPPTLVARPPRLTTSS